MTINWVILGYKIAHASYPKKLYTIDSAGNPACYFATSRPAGQVVVVVVGVVVVVVVVVVAMSSAAAGRLAP